MNHNSRHHRKPKSLGGLNTKDNISIISDKKHKAWHELFLNHTPQRICRDINEKYLDKEYMFICVKREEEDDKDT